MTNPAPRIVPVSLGARSYDVVIGPGLLAEAGARIAALAPGRKLAIITDETVAGFRLEALHASLAAAGLPDTPALQLPAGEATKSWAKLEQTVEWLLAQRLERSDLVVAFGGGVIGDLAGFAAAILRRGIEFVQIPTSLLAQVDSSVGGKTGINARSGKNLVGAFHQPALVLADTDVLRTLPLRDFRAGYGEVAKYGLLGDAQFFGWLERHGPDLVLPNGGAAPLLTEAIAHCVKMKADIVARDETEQGERALLNLGHTFGHALEAATGYSSRLLHGEGVAVGCVLAAQLSERLGLCDAQVCARTKAHFAAMGLPTSVREIAGGAADPETLIGLMAQDKKVQNGKLRFVLMRAIGEAFVTDQVPPEQLRAVLSQSGRDDPSSVKG